MHGQRLNGVLVASVLCVGVLPASWAYAQTCSERIAQSSYGIGIDMNGYVWVPDQLSGIVRKYAQMVL